MRSIAHREPPTSVRPALRTALLLGVCLLAAAPARARLWPRGDEAPVALPDPRPGVCSPVTWPSLSIQPNGGFLAGWTTTDRAVVRAFAPDGTPRGPVHALLREDPGSVPNPEEWQSRIVSTAAAGDEGYLAAWFQEDPSSGQRRVAWAALDAAGRPTGGGFSRPISAQSYPRVAALPDGTVLFAWLSSSGGQLSLNTQRFSRQGVVQAAHRSVDLATSRAPCRSSWRSGQTEAPW